MKYTFTFLALVVGSLLFSQDYKDKISREMCSCSQKIKTAGKSQKKLEVELGLCMLQVSKLYRRELKRDYNIDIETAVTSEQDLTQMGEVFGMLMLNDCPEVFSTFISDTYLGEDEPAAATTKMLNGTISKIEKDDFVVFHLSGDNRVLTKLHWISKVESDLDLPAEYLKLQNRRVTVSYFQADLFDPKTNQYRSVNLLTSLRSQ